jgi:hypothetical protein
LYLDFPVFRVIMVMRMVMAMMMGVIMFVGMAMFVPVFVMMVMHFFFPRLTYRGVIPWFLTSTSAAHLEYVLLVK